MNKPFVHLLLLTACSTGSFAQEAAKATPTNQHQFFDRKNLAGFSTTFALKAADVALTCYNLANDPNRRENWLPVKTCPSIAAYEMAGGMSATIGGTWLLHKTKHHKLERWIPYIAMLPNTAGIIYTVRDNRPNYPRRIVVRP